MDLENATVLCGIMLGFTILLLVKFMSRHGHTKIGDATFFSFFTAAGLMVLVAVLAAALGLCVGSM